MALLWMTIVSLIIVVVCLIIKIILNRNEKIVGTLRIDRSFSDEPPSIFFELNIPVEQLETKNEVLVRVFAENYISQK